jgi:hypothetical protein
MQRKMQLSILAERSDENVQNNVSRLMEAVKQARQDKFPMQNVEI